MPGGAETEVALMECPKYAASSLQYRPRLHNILYGNCGAKFSKSFKFFQ